MNSQSTTTKWIPSGLINSTSLLQFFIWSHDLFSCACISISQNFVGFVFDATPLYPVHSCNYSIMLFNVVTHYTYVHSSHSYSLLFYSLLWTFSPNHFWQTTHQLTPLPPSPFSLPTPTHQTVWIAFLWSQFTRVPHLSGAATVVLCVLSPWRGSCAWPAHSARWVHVTSLISMSVWVWGVHWLVSIRAESSA